MTRTVNGTGQVVLHIQLVGLFQVLPVHEPGAPINRRVTPLALGLSVGQYVARRVMLGRRRDGYITTRNARQGRPGRRLPDEYTGIIIYINSYSWRSGIHFLPRNGLLTL